MVQLQHRLFFYQHTSCLPWGTTTSWSSLPDWWSWRIFWILGKVVEQPQTLHLFSYPPQSCFCILLSLTVSWLGLKPDTLSLCMEAPQHNDLNILSNSQGGAGIPGSSLWSGNKSLNRKFDTKSQWVSKGMNLKQNEDLAEGKKFQPRTQFSFWWPQQIVLGKQKANKESVNISYVEIKSAIIKKPEEILWVSVWVSNS